MTLVLVKQRTSLPSTSLSLSIHSDVRAAANQRMQCIGGRSKLSATVVVFSANHVSQSATRVSAVDTALLRQSALDLLGAGAPLFVLLHFNPPGLKNRTKAEAYRREASAHASQLALATGDLLLS